MNKKLILHSLFYLGVIGLYFVSSPSVLDKIRPRIAHLAAEITGPQIADTGVPGTATIPAPSLATPPVNSPEPGPDPTPIEPEPQNSMVEYIQIVNSCGPYFGGGCVNVRTGPSSDELIVTKLRNGIVLRVIEHATGADGQEWYKIGFKEPIRYPERVVPDWYVRADFTRPFLNEGTKELVKGMTSTKHIVVDLSEQKMYAYNEDESIFMETAVSTGIPATPTPLGEFTIYRKTPSRYMQGPIPGVSDHYYDLPGVPWNLYFTTDGAVFHGAYWHTDFGKVHSNGCVNLPIAKAEELYGWADLGTKVHIQE
jgi:hypothetical protein